MLIAGLSVGPFAQLPAAANTPPVVYDNFNGSGDANGSAVESGGKTWQALNGAWTRSGSGTVTTGAATTSNPMLVADLGSGDVDAQLTTTGASGESAYVRVQDATNWVRARLSRTLVNFTDREYSTTHKQWEVEYYRVEAQWQDRAFQRQYSTTVYGSWSAWSTYGTSACQSSAGEVSLPADTDTTQYRTANGTTSGCAGGKMKWDKQSRTRSKSVSAVWVNDTVAPPAGYTATGSTRYLDVGSPYWGTPHPSSGGVSALLVSSRNVLDHTGWQSDSTVSAPNVLTGITRTSPASLSWWTYALQNATGYTDPCSYVLATTPYTDPICALTGQTRQGDPTGTSQYTVVLEKSVNGTVTTLGRWPLPLTTGGLRVTADGSTIKVYVGTGSWTLLGSVTETAFLNQTRHGCGLGGATDAATNALSYCSLQALRGAPSAPTDLAISPGGAGFTTSLIPTVSAVMNSPDGGELSANFKLKTGSQTVWSGSAGGLVSGQTATVTVGEDALDFGKTYTLEAVTTSGGQSSPPTSQTFQVDAAGPIVVSGCGSGCTPVTPAVTVFSGTLAPGESQNLVLGAVPGADDASEFVFQMTSRTASGTDVNAAIYLSNPDLPRPIAAAIKAPSTSIQTSTVQVMSSSSNGTVRIQNAGTVGQVASVSVIGKFVWNDLDEQSMQAAEDAQFGENPPDVELDPQPSLKQSIPLHDITAADVADADAAGTPGVSYAVNPSNSVDEPETCGPFNAEGQQLCTAAMSDDTFATELTTAASDETTDEAEAVAGESLPSIASRFPVQTYQQYAKPFGCDGGITAEADSRYYACHYENFKGRVRNSRGRVIGRGWMTAVQRIWTERLTDDVTFRFDIELRKATGLIRKVGVGGYYYSMPSDGADSDGQPKSEPWFVSPEDRTWQSAAWKDSSTLVSREVTPHQVAYLSRWFRWQVDYPVFPVTSGWMMGSPNIRCDTAGELGGMGCVFNGYRPTFTMLRGLGGKAPLTASHVHDRIAQGMASLLTRWKPGINANRIEAKKICNRLGQSSCDEYPFASTLEGCLSPTGCKTRGIPLADNKMGGSLLASFYQMNRVRNLDTFNVDVP